MFNRFSNHSVRCQGTKDTVMDPEQLAIYQVIPVPSLAVQVSEYTRPFPLALNGIRKWQEHWILTFLFECGRHDNYFYIPERMFWLILPRDCREQATYQCVGTKVQKIQSWIPNS